MRIRLLLLGLMLLPVLGRPSGPSQAQGTPLDEYMRACTTTETDLATAAETFGVTLEEMEFVNRAREDYREPYLIQPGCFFSTQLNYAPLSAESMGRFPFVLSLIEEDLSFSQLSPEGYFSRQDGFGSYLMYDFGYDTDAEGRWVWAGMALLTGGAPFGGHAIGYNGEGFDIRLEYDWIGQTFRHTFLVPQGPIVAVRGGYLLENDAFITDSLMAYDYASGDSIWSLPLDADPRAVFAAGERVVLVQAAGVDVLDAATGETLWNLPRAAALAVASDDSLLIWGEGLLGAYDLASGDARWEIATPERVYTHLAYADGTLVAAEAAGDLAAYSATDGALLWEGSGMAELTTAGLACEATHDCWRISSGAEGAAVEQFALADGSVLVTYTLPGETAESELALRVEPDGWVFVTGQHLHARTPTLAH